MNRKAWIRVDANQTIGRGHLSRCTALADMLKESFDITFLIKKTNKAFCDNLLEGRAVVYFIEDSELGTFLGQTDLLIVDSYDIDNDWRIHFQKKVSTLVDINDIPGDIRGADVIINHCPAIKETMYTADPAISYLLGLDFAILRPEFLKYAQTSQSAIQGEGIFICYGGADPYQLGIKAAQELLASGFSDPIYLVVPQASEILRLLDEKHTNLKVLQKLSATEMRDYMLKSRLLLLSSSILSFEAIALRKPQLVIYYVDNQKLIYGGLIKQGLAKGFGFISSPGDLLKIDSAVKELYHSNDQLEDMVKQQQRVLDGESGSRLLKSMKKSSN